LQVQVARFKDRGRAHPYTGGPTHTRASGRAHPKSIEVPVQVANSLYITGGGPP